MVFSQLAYIYVTLNAEILMHWIHHVIEAFGESISIAPRTLKLSTT
jgi:hypothetical protein